MVPVEELTEASKTMCMLTGIQQQKTQAKYSPPGLPL